MDTPYSRIIKNFDEETARTVAKGANDAIDLIENHIREYNIECGFERVSAFLFSQDDEQTRQLNEIHESCGTAGVESTQSNSIPVPISFQQAIEVKRQGKFIPVRYVYALAKAFEQAGGVILQHCRVRNAEEEETINIETTLQRIKANRLVYATHIPPGINLLHLRCPAYRSYAMAVRLSDDKYPGELCYDMYDPYHYYRTQEIDGVSYLIVGGEDHKTGEGENTNKHFLQLESHVRTYFQVSEISYRWSSQYYEPVDGLPYIGKLPGASDNIFVATGYGGNGITYSHVAALELTQWLTTGKSRYQEIFTPGRVKPVAGFTEFVKHNAAVVSQFVGKWFATERLDQMASLSPDEGKVIRLQKETMALYKDETGNLHGVNPTCTHMKCSVSWNSAEKSWDCPCHGARYSIDGEVLNGPADANLEVIELRSLLEKED
jgi:glycine/D-amino acid oxidase-like deaminating enzyme/nitrite reductase/ring-hydroxylating ferredoxin subunit